MTENQDALIIFSKNPIEGRVKTRLIPTWGTEGALHLYKDVLKKTIETAKQSDISNIYLYCTPDLEDPFLKFCARQYELKLALQQGKDLGERMSNALNVVLAQHSRAIIVGSDCPELSYKDINLSLRKLTDSADVVLGPTEDGGYYLIGMSKNHESLFVNINWGTESVLSETRKIIKENKLKAFELNQKWDLDRPDDFNRYFRSRG